MARFSGMKISTKFILLGLVSTAVFAVLVLTWIIPSSKDGMIEKKREKIQEQTEVVFYIAQHFYDMAKNDPAVSQEEAMAVAKETIRALRYGPDKTDYFWINDTKPSMVMHPFDPSLEGESLADTSDPHGVRFFVEFVKIAKNSGHGFFEYMWQYKDDKNKIVPKVSYISYFKPWDWVIGTGMYIQDVEEENGRVDQPHHTHFRGRRAGNRRRFLFCGAGHCQEAQADRQCNGVHSRRKSEREDR